MKTKQDQQTEQQEPVDLEEIYAIRARMLGVLIRDARAASGFSIEELAEAIDVSSETLDAWERGRQAPSLPYIELMAYILQVPISHFWGTETFAKQRSERSIDGGEYATLRHRMIGVLLKSAREEQGLSVDQLAAELDVHPDDVRGYEAGRLPVPMTIMTSLSSILNIHMNHFFEGRGRVGEFLEIREALEGIADLPEDVREFISVPSNQVYVRVAMALADIPTNNLRTLAENLLDITM